MTSYWNPWWRGDLPWLKELMGYSILRLAVQIDHRTHMVGLHISSGQEVHQKGLGFVCHRVLGSPTPKRGLWGTSFCPGYIYIYCKWDASIIFKMRGLTWFETSKIMDVIDSIDIINGYGWWWCLLPKLSKTWRNKMLPEQDLTPEGVCQVQLEWKPLQPFGIVSKLGLYYHSHPSHGLSCCVLLKRLVVVLKNNVPLKPFTRVETRNTKCIWVGWGGVGWGGVG